MSITANDNGQFTQRPDIGSFYRAESGAAQGVLL